MMAPACGRLKQQQRPSFPAAAAAALLLLLLLAFTPGASAHGHDGPAVGRHHHAGSLTVLQSATPPLNKATPMTSPQGDHYGPGQRRYCSCAHPTPLPVRPSPQWLRPQGPHITGEDDGGSSSVQAAGSRRGGHDSEREYRPPAPKWERRDSDGYDSYDSYDDGRYDDGKYGGGKYDDGKYGGGDGAYGQPPPHSYRHGSKHHDGGGSDPAMDDECAECNELPRVGAGGKCGAAIGICTLGYCCGQDGRCSKDPASCDGTCQCKYSGPGSRCKGSLPFALPYRLPTAQAGGVCGDYVAACPRSQCCSQFGFCVDDGSDYCRSPSCQPRASPLSATCVDAYDVAAAAAAGAGAATAAATTAPGGGAQARPAAAPAIDTSSPNYGYKRGAVRSFEWVVSWKNLTLDGFERPVIVINGEAFPNIYVDVGDRVIVSVTNRLNEGLSIHWHGMLQRRTNIMDGVVPVTQRPVAVGETYVYDFIADTPGTYWWHSHFKTQYVDGLWGGLVIRDPTQPQPPVDAVLTVNEWYHQGANALQAYYLSPASGGNEPVPYDALMNGLGQGYCVLNNLNNTCGYTRIKGVAGRCGEGPKTVLRIINAGAFAVFNVSVDNHRLVVIGEDGVPVNPVEVGSLQINNGQRYGVVVCQDSPGPVSEEPVWIRANMIDADFAYNSNYSLVLGVLYFRDADAAAIPTSQDTNALPALNPRAFGPGVINPYFLRVAGNVTPPGPATTTLQYVIEFYNEPPSDPAATQYAHMSNISLDMTPNAPSLLERLTNNPENLPPPTNPVNPPGGLGWHVVEVPRGAIVDIIINNRDTGEHPIHLHGHWFWVMDAGLPKAGDFNATKPPRPEGGRLARDTVTVNLESFIVLRYMAVNPGTWIMHCHIDWHLAGGLGLIFKEAFPPFPPHSPYQHHPGQHQEQQEQHRRQGPGRRRREGDPSREGEL